MCSRSSFDVHSSYSALAWMICRLCTLTSSACRMIYSAILVLSFLDIIYVCEILKPMILMFMTTCDNRHHNYGR